MSDLSSPAIITLSDPHGVAPERVRDVQADFCAALAQWGNVRAAAAQAGVSRTQVYRMRRASPEFRQLWDAALVLARPLVEEVLADRALNGVQEVVFYHGEEVASRTRFDARLLLAHLSRLDRVEEGYGVRKAVADFDERLERLRHPPVLIDDDDEDWDDGDRDDEDRDGAAGEYDAGDADWDAGEEDGADGEGADDHAAVTPTPAGGGGAAGSADFSFQDCVPSVPNTAAEVSDRAACANAAASGATHPT